MKIFVTGAGGLIGNATIRRGRERGHEMLGCDVEVPDGSDVRKGSIEDLAFLKAATAGCDAIIHTASLHSSQLHDGTSHGRFYDVNITGSDNVFRAALANKIPRVVFSSSLDIHCGTTWDRSGAVRYTENTPDVPTSIYALSKRMVEEMGHFYHRVHGIQFCAQRYVYIYGTIEKLWKIRPRGLIARILLVEDCADANLAGCASDRVYDDVLLIGPEAPLTNQDVVASTQDVEAVVEKYWPGSSEDFRQAGFKLDGELWPVCDLKRTWQVLGWCPQYTYDWLWQQVKDGYRCPEN